MTILETAMEESKVTHGIYLTVDYFTIKYQTLHLGDDEM